MATGHVRKRGSKWAFVHYVTDPATGEGKYRWIGGFSSKGDAQRALREAITAHETGTFVEPSKLTYQDYIQRLWLPLLGDQLETSTIESYERNMRVHVLPRIGGIRIQKLGPVHLNEIYRALQDRSTALPAGTNRRHNPKIYPRIAHLHKQGDSYRQIATALASEFPDETPLTKAAVAAIVARSRKAQDDSRTLSIRTVRYIHTIISRSLKDAAKLGFVNTNAASNASPPREPKVKPQKPMWTADQTRTFLAWGYAVDHRHWSAWAFIATSGDRRGANLGLRWQDIDFDEGTAQLTWTVTCVSHKIVVKPYGKTGGNHHQILLDRGTLATLRLLRARQNEERLIAGATHICDSTDPDCNKLGYHLRDLVFARPDGDYLHPERFSRELNAPNGASTEKTPTTNCQRSACTRSDTDGPPSPSKPESP